MRQRELKAKGDDVSVTPFLPVSQSQGRQRVNIFTGHMSLHDADISTRQTRDNAVPPRWAEMGGVQRVKDRRKQVREMERCWRREDGLEERRQQQKSTFRCEENTRKHVHNDINR